MALSSLPWATAVQVSKRLAKDVYIFLFYVLLSWSNSLAFQQRPLHWYMACNGVTFT